jgi:hypothetical protein
MIRIVNKDRFITKTLFLMNLFSIIISLSLGINYIYATVGREDGIAVNNFIAYWIIGDDCWSIDLFSRYFEHSLSISSLLLLALAATVIIEEISIKRKQNRIT